MTNLRGTADYVSVIQGLKGAIADAKGGVADVAFGDSIPHTYWGVFFDLKDYFWLALGVDIAVIFVWTLIFLRSPTAAFACALSAFTIVMEVYGLIAQFAFWNIFTASTLLMAMGISIEFVAHIIATFELLKGEGIEARIGETMARAIPPILKGTLSTFLAICGLAFSPIPLYVKYFFATISCVCAIGLLNAFVFLPCTLVLLAHVRASISGGDQVHEVKEEETT